MNLKRLALWSLLALSTPTPGAENRGAERLSDMAVDPALGFFAACARIKAYLKPLRIPDYLQTVAADGDSNHDLLASIAKDRNGDALKEELLTYLMHPRVLVGFHTTAAERAANATRVTIALELLRRHTLMSIHQLMALAVALIHRIPRDDANTFKPIWGRAKLMAMDDEWQGTVERYFDGILAPQAPPEVFHDTYFILGWHAERFDEPRTARKAYEGMTRALDFIEDSVFRNSKAAPNPEFFVAQLQNLYEFCKINGLDKKDALNIRLLQFRERIARGEKGPYIFENALDRLPRELK